MAPNTSQIFHVPPELSGQTITAALRQWLAGQSWNEVRRLLRNRHVQINGNLCLDEGRRLKTAEVVKLLPHPAAAPPTEEDVRIRYLDQHLVVVEKPAGMTTLRHPEERDWPRSRKQLQPTLDEILPRIIEKRERRGPGRGAAPGQRRKPSAQSDPPRGPTRRLRPVHRLDRETSGLMVFARTVDAERALGLQFRAHSLDRVYIAVALGHVNAQTFESNLVDDRGDGRRGSTPNPKLGKHAITHVRPLEALGKYTVVECRLETGRTHQIRIHLSEAGHPLCGDKVYRGRFPGPPLVDESGAPRVALHAAELGFEHPITGEPIHHVMPLPRELVELIDRLRPPGKRRSEPRPTATAEDGTPHPGTEAREVTPPASGRRSLADSRGPSSSRKSPPRKGARHKPPEAD